MRTIKIPQVSNYKEYVLTEGGVDVILNNGRRYKLIANNKLKTILTAQGKTLSADGNIIQSENKNKKENNISANKPKKKNQSKTTKSKKVPKAPKKVTSTKPKKSTTSK